MLIPPESDILRLLDLFCLRLDPGEDHPHRLDKPFAPRDLPGYIVATDTYAIIRVPARYVPSIPPADPDARTLPVDTIIGSGLESVTWGAILERAAGRQAECHYCDSSGVTHHLLAPCASCDGDGFITMPGRLDDQDCPDCHGYGGQYGDRPCDECGGRGKVTLDTITVDGMVADFYPCQIDRALQAMESAPERIGLRCRDGQRKYGADQAVFARGDIVIAVAPVVP